MAYEKDKHFRHNLDGPKMRNMWDTMTHAIIMDYKYLENPMVEQPSQWHTVLRFNNGKEATKETQDRPTIAEQLKQEYFFAPVEEY